METETDDLCGDISRDNIIDRTALDIVEKLPKTFEIWRVKETLQMKLCPTGVVLLQELQRYNGLVEHIEKTLKLLRKVCIQVNKFIFTSVSGRVKPKAANSAIACDAHHIASLFSMCAEHKAKNTLEKFNISFVCRAKCNGVSVPFVCCACAWI